MRSFFSVTLILLLSVPACLEAQSKSFIVKGKVIDEKTRQPLANASVFCQNTTVGTTSNNEGEFSLRLNNGGYDLVISYTSYDTKVMRISNGNKENDSMLIELKQQDKNMQEVVVAGSAEVADGWNKYGQFFLNNFIGTTPNAEKCSLENKDALKFYFYKKRNKLKVRAKEDLIITNNALGYKIKYQLDSFVYDYNTTVSSYTGYPLFQEIQGSPDQAEGWKKNRFASYIGSRLHFMRAWYDSTLKDEGFDLEIMDPTQQDKAEPIENPYGSEIYNTDSGTAVISIKGKLRINYRNHVPDKKYLLINKYPANTRFQISALDITDGIEIEENGYFYDQAEVTNSGYWAWKKLAELLPYDYNPE
jgi:hypothetical protein